MSTNDILRELPKFTVAEQELIAGALQALRSGANVTGKPRQPGLHEGAWEVAPDFDEPLPEAFWAGGEVRKTPLDTADDLLRETESRMGNTELHIHRS